MKHFLIVFLALIGIGLIHAESKPVGIVIRSKYPNSPIGNGYGRAPTHLPIEVMFDEDSGNLSVGSSEDMEGCVYVYNISGGLEASSQQLN